MRNGLAQQMARSPHLGGSRTANANWDATKTEAPTELLQDGFRLAYFILPDRSTAIDILVRALDKVRVRSRREIKRLYWRDKHAERPVRRIARSDRDVLQWLIMFEAEQDERIQEQAGNASLRSMMIRYIKHLVQLTTALSSFYVNVGVMRLLHTYSTSEAQRVYEMLTSRYLGSDEYRRAKATLMNNVSQRFEGFLKTTRVEHGELRFEACHDQERWAALVDDCLKAFTPWSTQRLCSQLAKANDGKTVVIAAPDADRNDLELRWCHIFIEPTCYSRLLRELAFDPPDKRLALPRFFMSEKQEKNVDNDSHLGHPAELSEEDLDEIQRRLAARDARRQNIDPHYVTLLIDGMEHKQFDLTEKGQLQVEVDAGASLIEIRGEDDQGDLLLATHVISYAENAFESSGGSAIIGRGKLKFTVAPVASSSESPSRAILTLDYHPRMQLGWPWDLTRVPKAPGRAIAAYALAGFTMVLIGWGLATTFYGHRIKLLEQQLNKAHVNQSKLPPTAARAIMSYTLTSDAQRVRGSEMAGIPEISLRLHSPAISLELALPQTREAGGYSAELKTFSGDQTLLTISFLQARRTDAGSGVELLVPSDLLKADTYYTVHLHSLKSTDHFTFRVVAE